MGGAEEVQRRCKEGAKNKVQVQMCSCRGERRCSYIFAFADVQRSKGAEVVQRCRCIVETHRCSCAVVQIMRCNGAELWVQMCSCIVKVE